MKFAQELCGLFHINCSRMHYIMLLHLLIFLICFSKFYKERTEIFQLLKSKRVSMEELDSEGHPPLYYAMKHPSGLVASLLPNDLKKVCWFL